MSMFPVHTSTTRHRGLCWENRTAEEEHARYQKCSKQLGTRLARASRRLRLRGGAQFKKPVAQQEKENLGIDTRRRLCGDRIEGESVGGQEAPGECVPTAKIIKALDRKIRWGEAGTLCQHDPRHVDVLVGSLELENGNTMQTPIVDDVKDENPVLLDIEQISKYRSHVARCLFPSQDIAAVNECRQRMSDPVPQTQLRQIEAARSVFEGREAMDPTKCSNFGNISHRSDSFLRLRMGWRSGNEEIVKRGRVALAGRHFFKAYTRRQKNHRQKQCRSRSVCSSIRSIRSERS